MGRLTVCAPEPGHLKLDLRGERKGRNITQPEKKVGFFISSKVGKGYNEKVFNSSIFDVCFC